MMMMKLDDRDIVCEQDYTPLSNAELVAHIETYARLMHSTPLSDGEWLDDIIGPARVLLARAEAAEALAAERLEDALFAEQRATDAELERDGAILAASDAERHAENAMHGLAHFRARVEELESALEVARDVLHDCAEVFWQDERAIAALARVEAVIPPPTEVAP